ncbi:redox-sensing transcriptional repressor Rex [Populibacterium corticicola]|uniref:Redox-sensing transcriptional repressor Rex n=1 Tax=Populibacterium corticicola TaxID=1812826 RepID=A0ABW5XFN2_9MICO
MKKVPLSTMERLPAYLRVIDSLVSHGVDFASSAQLASRAGVSSAQFRKDMSLLGASSGVRGAGYDLAALRVEFRQALGSAELVRFVIVGAGNLGQALAASSAFRRGGLDLAGIFDVAEGRVGQEIAGISVLHDDQLEEFISANEVSIAVIATPGSSAQQVADTVVRGGAKEILNFSPVVLQVPSTVEVRSIDLGVELQMLALHARNGA